MQVRENLAMDQETTFTRRKTYSISRSTLIFIASIFLCSIIATALLIYNFATCPSSGHWPSTDIRTAGHVISLNNGNEHVSTLDSHDTNTTRPQPILNLRLPRSIVPISYNLRLIPFLFSNNFTFSGEVQILVNVTENCNNITLHSNALTIRDSDVIIRKLHAGMSPSTSKPLDIKSQYFIEPKQFYVIELNDTLQNGSFSIEIKYTGVLNDLLQGFYRSSYNDANGTR